MSQHQKGYYRQLDAIRGLSFLVIYLYHAFHPVFTENLGGRLLKYFHGNLVLSIDTFFILSSFLLTYLGIKEYGKNGNFSFINYFIRRALRIWPLYYLLMIFGFVVLPYLSNSMEVPVSLPPPFYYLFFISNFYLEGHVYFLRFLWTLSVEEQFYLVWGICLLVFQRNLLVCAVLMIVISVCFNVYAILNHLDYYFNTLTYLFDFATGIIAAVFVSGKNGITEFMREIKRKTKFVLLFSLPAFFILFFILNELTRYEFSTWIDLAVRYIFICYAGLFIIEQMVSEGSFLKLASNKFLVYTGKISYGLYCFHGIILTFGIIMLEKLNISMPLLLRAVVLLGFNYLVAFMSYNIIEKPFLRLKNTLRRI